MLTKRVAVCECREGCSSTVFHGSGSSYGLQMQKVNDDGWRRIEEPPVSKIGGLYAHRVPPLLLTIPTSLKNNAPPVKKFPPCSSNLRSLNKESREDKISFVQASLYWHTIIIP